MDPHFCGHLIHDKGGRIYSGEKAASSINGVGKTGQQHAKEANWSASHTMHKTKLKWIKDLKVGPETIKLLEENIGSTLFDIGLSNIFLDMSPQAREK